MIPHYLNFFLFAICKQTKNMYWGDKRLEFVKTVKQFFNKNFYHQITFIPRWTWKIWFSRQNIDCNPMQLYWNLMKYYIHNCYGMFRHVTEGIPIRIYRKIQYQTCLPNMLQFYFWRENQIFYVQRGMEEIRR